MLALDVVELDAVAHLALDERAVRDQEPGPAQVDGDVADHLRTGGGWTGGLLLLARGVLTAPENEEPTQEHASDDATRSQHQVPPLINHYPQLGRRGESPRRSLPPEAPSLSCAFHLSTRRCPW